MSHDSRIDKVVVDVPESAHDRELAFWRGVIPDEPGRLNDENAQRWD